MADELETETDEEPIDEEEPDEAEANEEEDDEAVNQARTRGGH